MSYRGAAGTALGRPISAGGLGAVHVAAPGCACANGRNDTPSAVLRPSTAGRQPLQGVSALVRQAVETYIPRSPLLTPPSGMRLGPTGISAAAMLTLLPTSPGRTIAILRTRMQHLGTALSAALLCTACALAPKPEPEPWSFIQSVGGVRTGTPQQSEGQWRLPVTANLSGTDVITHQPTALNSAISCHSTAATVEASSIYITIYAGLVENGREARCPPAAIPQLRPGTYQVLYRGPNEKPVPVGEFVIAERAHP
jgi:hypothetical protein